MKYIVKVALVFLYIAFMEIVCFSEVRAEQDSENTLNQLSFELEYPGNQEDPSLGYFDLSVQPGQKQSITMTLFNHSTKECTTQIDVSSAKTNSAGIIEYSPNKIQKDSSLTYDVTSLVSGPDQVTIPANGQKNVTFMIHLPKEISPGIIAGGIQLKPFSTFKDNQDTTSDIVENEFAYVIGLLLRVGDTTKISPKLVFNNLYFAYKDGIKQLILSYSNTQPSYLEDMQLSVQIRKTTKQKDLIHIQKKEMRMAPNTRIDFPIDLSDKRLPAGDYTADITVKGNNSQSWSWTEDFKVTQSESGQLRKDQNSNLLYHLWFWSMMSGLLIISGILVFYYVKRKRQKNLRKR